MSGSCDGVSVCRVEVAFLPLSLVFEPMVTIRRDDRNQSSVIGFCPLKDECPCEDARLRRLLKGRMDNGGYIHAAYCDHSCDGSCNALSRARALMPSMQKAIVRHGGDVENYAWWEQNRSLFDEAWKLFGQGTPEVYHHDSEHFVPQTSWLFDVNGINTPIAKEKITEVVPGVYSFPLFTEAFCTALLDELDLLNAAGIPMRRPNGMNRYGAILSHLRFDGLLDGLLEKVVKPLGTMLYPDCCGPNDCEEAYGFTVRYTEDEDLELAEHSDTSNVTLNICLGREFTGGDLYFKGVRYTDSWHQQDRHDVKHRPGHAVLHLGGHIHAAQQLTTGERTNLILWATARGGKVRIVPVSEARF